MLILRGLKVTLCCLILLLALSVMPAVADETVVSRSVLTGIQGWSDLQITLEIEGMPAGGIIETLPEGFTFLETDHPADRVYRADQQIIFSVIEDETIIYTARSQNAGSNVISGRWDNLVENAQGIIADTLVNVESSGGGSSGGSVAGTGTSSLEKTLLVADSPIRSIVLKSSADISSASAKVEKTELPEGTPAPEGAAYEYLEIDLRNIAHDDLTGATIWFSVDRSWIDEQRVDDTGISLFRYQNGWDLLPTRRLSSDDTDDALAYEAETPGFSLFAIAVSSIPGTENPTPKPTTAKVTTAPTASQQAAISKVPVTPAEKASSPLMGSFIGGCMVLLIIGLGSAGCKRVQMTEEKR
ncbi:PGF-pre-PGF domain-containing protein [Methanocalculus sp.]|uniref:PGF-pre-PGF domain-containing protein n=1 Tax=Methanocalculus sp. TaxID=2004547 RepID=UPI002724FAF0|nr:PGF-pre-PGF domain-containing protein [Methanocalculus sp.]MDO8841243.1 PGF-pre-PGF domain-containing protein [Methanocalculus sp.]